MYNPMFFDSTFLILIPAMILAAYAQMNVSSTFGKYNRVPNRKGLTGADVANQLLNKAGIHDVRVEHIRGNLTDHYDPRTRVVRLSDAVYGATSIAAISVAAHETGHALQHDQGYVALGIRNSIFPVVSIGSHLATPLIFIGLLLSSGSGSLGMALVNIGIIMFSCVVAFQVITLPVEFNASSRAIDMLEQYNFLDRDEITPAKKVLRAAALTYVAAAASAILTLIRFILIANNRNRRD